MKFNEKEMRNRGQENQIQESGRAGRDGKDGSRETKSWKILLKEKI